MTIPSGSPGPTRPPALRAARLGCPTLLMLLAIVSCVTATAQNPSTLPASLNDLFRQGVEAQKAGRLDEAEKDFLAVIARGGKVSFVYNNLGAIYQMRGEHEKAIPRFQEAVRLQPDYAAPRILLGASLLALGRIPEATRQLEVAVKIQPNEPLGREQLAKAYEQGGNFAGAVGQYRALTKLKPAEPEYAYQLGSAYLRFSSWCYREMAAQHPNSVRVLQSLAENQRTQGQLDSAARTYLRATEADPHMPEIHLQLASIYIEQGKLEEARREVDAELAIMPYSAGAIEMKARVASLSGR